MEPPTGLYGKALALHAGMQPKQAVSGGPALERFSTRVTQWTGSTAATGAVATRER